MVVVVDTNIWISALQFSKLNSVPQRALERAVYHDTMATSHELELEIYRMLTGKFGWPRARTTALLETFHSRSISVQLTYRITLCRDPKDNMFLEGAALAQAEVLVAGDKDLLTLAAYGSTRIITPLEYLAL